MPNRIIRENILSSVPVCSLDWPAELFYRRLMSVVDDYGRYEAIPALLRAKCYPLQVDRVREADISRWLAACQTAGLIVLYSDGTGGKQYLEIAKFGQQQRTPSKYPSPKVISNDSKCEANAHLDVSVVVGVVEDVKKKCAPAHEFVSFWEKYPRKIAKKKAESAFATARKSAEQNHIMAGLDKYIGYIRRKDIATEYIKHPTTWLNGGCWDDDYGSVKHTMPDGPQPLTLDEKRLLEQFGPGEHGSVPV